MAVIVPGFDKGLGCRLLNGEAVFAASGTRASIGQSPRLQNSCDFRAANKDQPAPRLVGVSSERTVLI